jgi:hypothetical protein
MPLIGSPGPEPMYQLNPPPPLIGPTYTNNGPPETVTTNNTKYRGGSRISSYGGALIKIAPSGGRREKFWGISCEKTRFYGQKIIFFPIAEGDAKNFGVFRVKNHDFTPKKSYFFQF